MRIRNSVVASAFVMVLAAAPATPVEWAFPGPGPTAVPIPSTRTYRLHGASATFTEAAIQDMTHAVDWFPNEHPPAPRSVIGGSRTAYACGYCHLADGAGRTENAQVRGLPVTYVEEQVRAFANGGRRSAGSPDPTTYMIAAARAVSPADLHAAAIYFAALEPRRHAHVIEARTIPQATPEDYVYRFDTSTSEPLGNRIVEGATDTRQHRLRDPHEQTVAYVPVGSIARGAVLANHGTATVPACAACHTTDFVGIGGDRRPISFASSRRFAHARGTIPAPARCRQPQRGCATIR